MQFNYRRALVYFASIFVLVINTNISQAADNPSAETNSLSTSTNLITINLVTTNLSTTNPITITLVTTNLGTTNPITINLVSSDLATTNPITINLTSTNSAITNPVTAAPAITKQPAANSVAKTNNLNAQVPWSIKAAAGLTLTKGNSDTLVGTLSGEAMRKWGPDELELAADLTYGENNGTKNTELYRALAQQNHLFTERFYGAGRIEGMHDGIADIQYRFLLNPGVGYYFVKNPKSFLRGEVGPGYIFEERGDETKNYPTVRFGERGERLFSKSTRVWEAVEVLPQVDDFKNFIVNAEVGIEVAINSRWSLRSCLQDTYNNVPAAGKKQNDIKLITGVAFAIK